MILYPAFMLNHGIKTVSGLGAPKLNDIDTLELPKASIYHYLGEGVEHGPSNDEYVVRDPSRVVFIEHATTLAMLEGNPRAMAQGLTKMQNDYKQRYRRFRPVRRIESVLADPKIILVENYAMLPHLYRYNHSAMVNWFTWKNQFATMVKRVNELAEITLHQQFIVCNLPQVLPTLSQLHMAEKKVDRNVLEIFNTHDEYFLLDLFALFGKHSENSLLSKLTPKAMEHFNIIYLLEGKWTVFNLGKVKNFILTDGDKDGGVSSGEVQTNLLKGLTHLFESKIVAVPAPVEKTAATKTPEEIKADLNATGKIVIKDVAKVQTIETGIMAKGNEMAEIGMLSGAEYRRVQKLADAYKTIDNPFGKGKFADLLTIKPEDIALPTVPVFKDNDEIIDKTMLVSRLHEFDAHYIKNLYRKDLATTIAGVQKFGIAVTNYRVEEVIDAMGGYEVHSVQLTPVVGSPSTIHFKLPIIDDRGVFTANGVKYRLRRQRGDVPIRKVKPNVVALTSYTAKLFVTRSERADSSYYRWFTNQIVMKALDKLDTTVTDMKMGKVASYDTKLPRILAEMSERIDTMRIKDIMFSFNYSKRAEVFGADVVKAAESKGMFICGVQNKKAVTMDMQGTLYVFKGPGDYEPLGTIESLLELDVTKAPIEKLTLGIYGQEIPMGLVLGYLIGLENVLKLLKVKFRRVPFGTRTNMQPDEWALRFKDESLIFSRNDRLATMVLASMRLYKNSIIDYPVDAFNNKEVYSSVMESENITLRYIRELKTLNQGFIDHITEGLLKEMGEPTVFGDLLVRACEMVMTNDCPDEVDTTQMRIKGYERVTAAVHTELMKAIRVYTARPATSKAAIELPPNAVWNAIQKDPAIGLVEESNPIHNLKELEIVTYSGTGGRSSRSMVKRTRKYHHNDMGVISEATVDSGDVGIISYLSADPGLTNLRGVVKPWDGKEVKPSQLISTSMLISPCADTDDKNCPLDS